MNISYRISIFVLSFLSFTGVHGQIWPGDVSDNGIVDGIDWLYLGSAFGNSGPERSEVSTVWAAHNAPGSWEGNFPEGHDHAYADCNGDGRVDAMDGMVILDNFNRFRDNAVAESLSVGRPGFSPAIFMADQRRDTISVTAGRTINIPISLGDLSIPVEQYYGLRFKLSIPDSLSSQIISIGLADNTWVGDNEVLQETFASGADEIDFAMTRIDGDEQSGSGPILNLAIVVEENLVFLQSPERVFPVGIDSLKLVDKSLNTLDVIGDTLTIRVFRDSASQVTGLDEVNPIAPPLIQVYPNPARSGQELYLEQDGPATEQIWTLYDINGKPILNKNLNTFNGHQRLSMQMPKLPPGIYFFKVQSPQGIITKKILVVNN